MIETVKNELFEGIISKKEYLKIYPSINKYGTVLISIHNPDDQIHPDNMVKGFDDVLQIKFWDIDTNSGEKEPITDEQGKELYNFIVKNNDKKFLIHCEAGISRSAGVGCAVECIVNFNGEKFDYAINPSVIKSHKRYAPNLKVYDTIIKNVKERL